MATSATVYYPYDAGSGANITEDQWRLMMGNINTHGVVSGYLNELAVTGDGSGMQVKLATGGCWINGAYGENSTSVQTISIAAAHATLNRYDLIVARNNYTSNVIEWDVIQGTNAASPTIPTVTIDTTKYEIALAYVYVAAAVSTITAANVTDQRPFNASNNKFVRTATLLSPGDTLTLDNLPARKYLKLKVYCGNSGSIVPSLRLNNTSTSTYSYVYSFQNASGTGFDSATSFSLQPASASESYGFVSEIDIVNINGIFKMIKSISWDLFGVDATTSVNYSEMVGKWTGTSQVNRIDIINSSTGDFTTGSEIHCIGSDLPF